jgi:enhancing lycopene biosynthesis protein 2
VFVKSTKKEHAMTTVAVILSGCGVLDGAEIHESVLTLLRLNQLGVQYQCFAPSVEQSRVVNHLTGQPSPNETRNVLVEAARIARGNIIDISLAKIDEFDAVILPGGFGAVTNLCDFAVKGSQCDVQVDVAQFLRAMHRAQKPIGLICISPVLAPKLFNNVKCTIGNDKDTANKIIDMGAEHIPCDVEHIVVDEKNRLVTTPAYMLANNLNQLFIGISRLVDKVVELSQA